MYFIYIRYFYNNTFNSLKNERLSETVGGQRRESIYNMYKVLAAAPLQKFRAAFCVAYRPVFAIFHYGLQIWIFHYV